MNEYSQMQHGYAITAHASQGATVDNAYFYASSFNSKEMAYVSASRQRHECEIFASEEEVGSEVEQELENLMGKSDEKFTALEKLEAEAKKNGIDTTKVSAADLANHDLSKVDSAKLDELTNSTPANDDDGGTGEGNNQNQEAQQQPQQEMTVQMAV